jgi:hypothetical protein
VSGWPGRSSSKAVTAAAWRRLDLTPAAVAATRPAVERPSRRGARRGTAAGAPGQGVSRSPSRPRRFDQQYDDLAAGAPLPAETGGGRRRAFAAARVAFIEERFATSSPRPGADPGEALAQVSPTRATPPAVRGPAPSWGEQLCQQHCPVSHVAHEFPQLCEAETEAIGRSWVATCSAWPPSPTATVSARPASPIPWSGATRRELHHQESDDIHRRAQPRAHGHRPLPSSAGPTATTPEASPRAASTRSSCATSRRRRSSRSGCSTCA